MLKKIIFICLYNNILELICQYTPPQPLDLFDEVVYYVAISHSLIVCLTSGLLLGIIRPQGPLWIKKTSNQEVKLRMDTRAVQHHSVRANPLQAEDFHASRRTPVRREVMRLLVPFHMVRLLMAAAALHLVLAPEDAEDRTVLAEVRAADLAADAEEDSRRGSMSPSSSTKQLSQKKLSILFPNMHSLIFR